MVGTVAIYVPRVCVCVCLLVYSMECVDWMTRSLILWFLSSGGGGGLCFLTKVYTAQCASWVLEDEVEEKEKIS